MANIIKQLVNQLTNGNTFNKVLAIKKALKKRNTSMLDINEFIQTVNFEIDEDTFDRFYHNLQDDIPIYLDENIIKWCGYEGELFNQKRRFMELIQSNGISIIELNNTEYVEFCNSVYQTSPDDKSDTNSENTDIDYSTLYPDPKTFNSKAQRTKHILIMPDDFKKVVMMLKTKKGNQIREYYISLEKLIKIYMEYQLQFKSRHIITLDERLEIISSDLKQSNAELKESTAELKQSNRFLNRTNHELRSLRDDYDTLDEKFVVAVNQRVPLAQTDNLNEKFILIRLRDTDPNAHEYYCIRGQKRNANKKADCILDEYDNAEIVLNFSDQPNPKNLYTRIKEEMSSSIDYTGNYISPFNISHCRFLRRIREINRERMFLELDRVEE